MTTIQCNFCKMIFPSKDELQEHVVVSCSAIEDDDEVTAVDMSHQGTIKELGGTTNTTTNEALINDMVDVKAVDDLSVSSGVEDASQISTSENVEDASQISSSEDVVAHHAAEVKKVIAQYIVDAPCNKVKDVLRLYSLQKSYKQQKAAFNTHSKADIIETLEFLGDTSRNWNNELKASCSHGLIYRINSLMPEECGICHETYIVKPSDTHLLSCSICGQEVHHKCYKSFFDLQDDTGNPLMDRILKATGFHFLCSECEDDVIPENHSKFTAGRGAIDQPTNDASKSNTEKSALKLSNNVNTIASISHSKTNQRPHLDPVVVITAPSEVLQGEKQEIQQEEKDQSTETCRHYRNNKCKYGISGKGCPYNHPKRCAKLMNHGTRATKGCNLGNKCKDFHPKMCPLSLSKSECLDLECALCHVKGTKRRVVPSKSPTTKSESAKPQDNKVSASTEVDSLNKSSLNESFLCQVNLLKKELQEMVENKLTALFPSRAYSPQGQLQFEKHQMSVSDASQVTPCFPTNHPSPASPLHLKYPQMQFPQMQYPQMQYPQMHYPHPASIPWMHQRHQLQQTPQLPIMGY